ncbi:MAG TPA: hypothetical protein VKB59_13090 [Micromonosporaceae bacterium]|nr:hypothetical protein [Micromonosporaceae bacterium]
MAETATVEENGEAWWTAQHGEAAINALADAGFVILGLDLREHDGEGRFVEVAWSDYRPTGTGDVERGRAAALKAWSRRDRFGNAVLISWQHPDAA